MQKISYKLFGSFFFSVILFLILTAFTQPQKADDKIYWSKDRPLTWDDFKGKPIKAGAHDAFTDSGIDFNYLYHSKDNSLVVELKTNFVKNKSSVNPKKKVDELLKHEQVHFDISEIYTRKFRKELMNTKFKAKSIDKKMFELSNKYMEELRKEEDLYDRETKHSANKEKQEEWNKKVEKELKELEKYTETNFTFEVK